MACEELAKFDMMQNMSKITKTLYFQKQQTNESSIFVINISNKKITKKQTNKQHQKTFFQSNKTKKQKIKKTRKDKEAPIQ